MFTITATEKFRQLYPQFKGVCIEASVINPPTAPKLWSEVEGLVQTLRTQYDTTTIKLRPAISAIRQAYKLAGKDPSRYRPACEQLARRILQGKSLYSVNTLTDIGNLLSLQSGYSTAALDADRIEGHHIELDFGQTGEPYEAIGRGVLNIEHLPVYRDARGAFATPTSDSTRTMVSGTTTHFLLLVNGYDGNIITLEETISETKRLLEQFAGGHITNVLHY